MAIPKFEDFLNPFFTALADGQIHSLMEIKKAIKKTLRLTEADIAEMLPSETESVFSNRSSWAGVYLRKAGLIERTSRSHYRLTSEGEKALHSKVEITYNYLKQYPAFIDFKKIPDKRPSGEEPILPPTPPEETLKANYEMITASLASDLLEEIMKLTPTDFEKLVLKLLLKMGYGSGIEDSGWVTPPSNDEGIDGIIKEDQLGFSSIYIQAKQWDPKRTIDRPEIQKFAGALQGQQAQKGLFITTASFTQGAKNYVDKINSTIVLIDGSQLTRLMIRHNLGVSVTSVYEIKRIDSDFFIDIQES